MKFRVTMKDPDVLHDAIREAVKREVEALGLDDDEKESIVEGRCEKQRDKVDRWFRYGEYLTVEVDTDAMTCVVIPETP